MTKKPNFFIIGAPRCGTTSLAKWLGEHPSIFMSPIKEPFFYSPDVHQPAVLTKDEYEGLFKKAGPQHIAIGEASTSYLFSRVAVPQIEEEYPGARYVVMIRNPIEMVFSLYRLCIVIGEEDITDIEVAWHLSPARREGKVVSRLYLTRNVANG